VTTVELTDSSILDEVELIADPDVLATMEIVRVRAKSRD
jgi:hypothetical protein